MTSHHGALYKSLYVLFKKQSRVAIVTEATFVVMLIGYLDYLTGYEISLFVFYAVPIFITVWYADAKCGIFVALLSAITWWWSDEKAGHPYVMRWVQGWDTAVRLFFFLFIVAGISTLKERYELIKRSRKMERQIIRISEREQKKIGQELHDGLCQYFAAIGCAASSLTDDLRKHSAVETEAAAEIADLLMKGVVQTRNLARGLFPVQKQENGLDAALHELAESGARLLNIDCTFESKKRVPVPDNEKATHLYRIAQEALNNAKRHGRATKVTITLEEAAGKITLAVRDNGKGFSDADIKPDSMGLKIMDYRARSIGGRLEVENCGDGGTLVRCSFMLNREDKKRVETKAQHPREDI